MSIHDIIQSSLNPASRSVAVFHFSNEAYQPSLESLEQSTGIALSKIQSLDTDTGIESQQIDQAIDERVNQTLKERLEALENAMPPGFKPDGLNYYLIDPQGLDAATAAEQQALRNLVRAALYDPQRTIAAFIPVVAANAPTKGEQFDGVESTLRINRHLTDFLSERGVTLITSAESLEEHVALNAEPVVAVAPEVAETPAVVDEVATDNSAEETTEATDVANDAQLPTDTAE